MRVQEQYVQKIVACIINYYKLGTVLVRDNLQLEKG